MHEIEFNCRSEFANEAKMAQLAKRAKVTLNLKQKVEIMAKLDKGILGSVLATEYEVTRSTTLYVKGQKFGIFS